jgi:peptidoglycan hydrolase-like protein with peptidoglycan-binding domain
VAILQKALGLSLADRNGYFGPITRAAVVRVQQKVGLAADGVVSGEEWKAIRSSLV